MSSLKDVKVGDKVTMWQMHAGCMVREAIYVVTGRRRGVIETGEMRWRIAVDVAPLIGEKYSHLELRPYAVEDDAQIERRQLARKVIKLGDAIAAVQWCRLPIEALEAVQQVLQAHGVWVVS